MSFYQIGFTKRYNPSQPRDENGRWTGGVGLGASGYRLSAESAAAVVHENARRNEPRITTQMQVLAARHGGTLEGLAFRLKEPKSLTRKINQDADVSGMSDDAVAATVSDAVRYTMKTEEHSYTKLSRSVTEDLTAAGYTLRTKNYWAPGDPYQGINVAVTSPDGQRFELQFHTDASLKVKEAIHVDYNIFRESTNDDERVILWNRMVEQAASIPVPPGVESIPELRVQSL